ncbi:MAG: hypothetical protein OXC13_05965 [Caldilineaceae bacterium]|nr:hypothetical protein [Caldilineaceae bacterium]
MLDHTPQADAARIGEPLEEALSHCKDAVVLWADTEHYEEVSNGSPCIPGRGDGSH